jgi:hypothetical protein
MWYDWSHHDTIVGAAAQQGIRVLPTVYSTPSWVAARPNYPPSQDHFGDFRAFVQTAAERYGYSGTFWAANPGIPKLPIASWQLWNEVNSPTFWYAKPKAQQYAALLQSLQRWNQERRPDGEDRPRRVFPTPRIRHGIRLDRYLPALPGEDQVRLRRIHGPHRGIARLTQEGDHPPAIAGRITTVSESDAPVSSPSSTRTSSSLR